MKLMFKNIWPILCLLIITTLNCACKFPDNVLQLPDINNYKLDKLKFGQTSIDDFKKLCPDAIPEKLTKFITVINTEPVDKDLYKKIRVGFKDRKLDWIEFVLNDNVELAKLVEMYNKPKDINTTYSKQLDYYDYDFFNISADKKHKYAKCINIFGIPNPVQEYPATIGDIPDLKNLKNDFLGLKPGLTLETEFNDKYTFLAPRRENKFDTTSTYILVDELGPAKTYYKKVTLVFNNGLLGWINITPQNLPASKALGLYGRMYKLETLNSRYDLYDYSNFVLIVDRAGKKVINIGII